MAQLTPKARIATDKGVVPAGSHGVAFENIGTTDVVVLGIALKPTDSPMQWSFDDGTIGEIEYDATGGQLKIIELR